MGGHEGVYHQFAPLPNPTGMTHFAGPISVAESLLNIGLLLIILTCGAGLLSRFRRAGSEEREQLKWFLYVIALVCVDIVVAIPVGAVIHSHWVGDIEWILGAYAVAFGLPVANTLAVPKFPPLDIDLVINKSVVFGAMAAFITAVYVAIVVGIGGLLGSGSRPNLVVLILASGICGVSL